MPKPGKPGLYKLATCILMMASQAANPAFFMPIFRAGKDGQNGTY